MFANEELLLQNLTSESPQASMVPMLAGIVFDGVTDPNKPLPNDMKVALYQTKRQILSLKLTLSRFDLDFQLRRGFKVHTAFTTFLCP
jgi:hypothetical protein